MMSGISEEQLSVLFGQRIHLKALHFEFEGKLEMDTSSELIFFN